MFVKKKQLSFCLTNSLSNLGSDYKSTYKEQLPGPDFTLKYLYMRQFQIVLRITIESSESPKAVSSSALVLPLATEASLQRENWSGSVDTTVFLVEFNVEYNIFCKYKYMIWVRLE